MIGIVVVSQSSRLARAAVDLALEMVVGVPPAIAIAAGAGAGTGGEAGAGADADAAGAGVTGTDAERVAAAIAEVSSPDGVLVIVDSGRAMLSAQAALELTTTDVEVRLTSAPFVEGLLAGIVRAADGATLDDVIREARGASAEKLPKHGNVEPGITPVRPPGVSLGDPVGVSPGRAVGPVVRMPEPLTEPEATGVLGEAERAAAAQRIVAAATSVESTLRKRAARLTGEARKILEATALMATDPTFLDSARAAVIDHGDTPEAAVWTALGQLADLLSAGGGRMAERVADLYDVRNRIVAALLGRPARGLPDRAEPFILVARDLAPADTALLDPTVCRALVTAEGGPTSHTAILARSLGIPALVAAAAALDIPEGTVILVDGTTGAIILNPTEEQIADHDHHALASVAFNGRGETADGHPVQLLANVASPQSVANAIAAMAQGVGLFRTEFCFLDRSEAPSVEEQVAAYREVFAAFAGRKVIIRTLDAGADKPLPFVIAVEEVNPALGIRGYRTSRRTPELLDDQLRAIAQAAEAENADVGVMAPMISTADEAADFARRCARVGLSQIGVMIETPAAAVTAREVLEQVDFVSVGTNDLGQYTMAADRQVGELALLNDPWQPAVLRMIQLACSAGAEVGKPVGVCGEAASDPLFAAVLVGLGATSLSMSARSLGPVAELLRGVSLAQCRSAATSAAAAHNAREARAVAVAILSREFASRPSRSPKPVTH